MLSKPLIAFVLLLPVAFAAGVAAVYVLHADVQGVQSALTK